MQRLVAVELKLNDFRSADFGQMELYLRWLDRHERQPSEQAPLGIILCAGKKRETVEYLDLDARGIHVAEYLTELPPRTVLEARLHRAIEAARARVSLGSDLRIRRRGARARRQRRNAPLQSVPDRKGATLRGLVAHGTMHAYASHESANVSRLVSSMI